MERFNIEVYNGEWEFVRFGLTHTALDCWVKKNHAKYKGNYRVTVDNG